MTFRTTPRLWALLPAVLRTRDIQTAGELDALLQLLAWQVGRVEDDVDQLYRDWFIETCAPWVLPWIGNLVGYRAPEHPARSAAGARPWHVPSLRRDVADTVQSRRRKGTVPILEQLAADVAGWSGRVVEFHRSVIATAAVGPRGSWRPSFVDLRDVGALHRIGGAFDRIGYRVDVRHVDSPRTPGRYNLDEVGLFVWRLRSYAVNRFPAFRVDEERRFTFSTLGQDIPLMTRTEVQDPAGVGVSNETDVATPLTRQLLQERLAAHYGEDRSVFIWTVLPDGTTHPVPAERIAVADLGGWSAMRGGYVIVDPQRGRLLFPADEAPPYDVLVTYCYGFPADLGGGSYPRSAVPVSDRLHLRVGPGALADLATALQEWQRDGSRAAVVELSHDLYEEHPEISIPDGHHLEIRAAAGARVELRIINRSASRADPLVFRRREHERTGDSARPRLTLDGLIIFGGGVACRGAFEDITVRHCTLTPHSSATTADDPRTFEGPSLALSASTGAFTLQHVISGPVLVEDADGEPPAARPVDVRVEDTILDATRPHLAALIQSDGSPANVTATIRRTTVIGTMQVRWLALAEDALFAGVVRVAHRQSGCVRFSYLPPGSLTPHRYRCQPDLALAAVGEDAGARRAIATRLRPQFESTRHGHSGYLRLTMTCPGEIREGAEHGLEMGVFHDLLEPYRLAALTARLEEFVPATMHAAVIRAT